MPMSGRAYSVILKAASWMARVAPTLAPSESAMPSRTATRPPDTRPSTVTAVAVPLWVAAETAVPASSARNGERVAEPIQRRVTGPAVDCSAAAMRAMPSRNSARPPRTTNMVSPPSDRAPPRLVPPRARS